MRTKHVRAIAGLLAVCAIAPAHAFSQEAAAESNKAASSAASEKEAKEESTARIKDPEKVTCKYTKVLGSRISQRVCMTNFEWHDREATQRETQRNVVNRNSTN